MARVTRDWVGLGDASRLLGISPTTMRRWSDTGVVPSRTTAGGHRRFSRAALRAMAPGAPSHRAPLRRLGVSAERMTREYRTAARRSQNMASPIGSWRVALTEGQRDDFRDRGRRFVGLLVAHLDASDAALAESPLQEAAELAALQGRQLSSLGASLSDAVATFLEFRTPFITSLATAISRRSLDPRQATDLLMAAERAMDRLLLATMTGHSLASGAGGDSVIPGPRVIPG